MSADIIDLAARAAALKEGLVAFPGNGAREVILEWLELAPDREAICDKLLMRLWERGFKIVPLGGGD